MQAGDYIKTPRFLTVRIKKVFLSEDEARKKGYNETTHYEDKHYNIYGKLIGHNKMEFAGIKKQ